MTIYTGCHLCWILSPRNISQRHRDPNKQGRMLPALLLQCRAFKVCVLLTVHSVGPAALTQPLPT